MLIYNHNKEFIGIDKHEIEALGCSSFEEILNESIDFADLFVKSPGYIHNFRHVHWIDFIACAENSEDAKVIITIKKKNFKATITIDTFYLIDNPHQPAYLIKLNDLRALTAQENEQISGDILARPAVQTSSYTPPTPPKAKAPLPIEEEYIPPVVTPTYKEDPLEEKENIIQDEYDSDYEEFSFADDLLQDDYDMDPIPTSQNPTSQDSIIEPKPEPVEEISDFDNDFKIDLEGLDDELLSEVKQSEPSYEPEPKLEIDFEPAVTTSTTALVDDDFDNSYVYNPQVASEELGLPIDLIEEFIQDFIAQAEEFNEPLHKSLNENDIDNIKILSHKLKGVAANLRIEDAFNVLVTINSSDDIDELNLNLARFYKIIAKLSGKEDIEETSAPEPEITAKPIPALAPEISEIEEDIFEDSFKDDMFDTPIEIEKEESKPSFEEEIFEDDLYMDNFETKEEVREETPDDFIFNPDASEDLEDFSLDLDFKDDEIPVSKPQTVQSNYNKVSVANEIGLDLESFNELFEGYLDETSRILKAFDTAILNEDLEMCKKIAFNLKGMSDNMRLNEISKELEAIITASDIDSVVNNVAFIKKQIALISNIED